MKSQMTIPDEAVQAAMDAYDSRDSNGADLIALEAAITAVLPFLQGVKVDAQGIYDYVQSYEWRGDNGDYSPNDADREMLEDAIVGYLSAIEAPTTSKMEAVAPSPRAQALEEGDLLKRAALIIEGRSTAVNSEFIESLSNRKAWEVAEIIADHDIRLGAEIRALSSQPVATGGSNHGE